MNPVSLGEARKLFLAIRKSIIRRKLHATVSIAPPNIYLSELESLSPSERIELCAQDAYFEKSGTHTGEVSPWLLKSVGVTSVIIGHSERRAMGETDEIVLHKMEATLAAGLTAIVCVGETMRDSHGHYFTVVEKQLRSFLSKVPRKRLGQLVIAYEPIWAISKGDGKGKTATAEDAQEMKLFIQKTIADVCTRKAIEKVRIIYGGSVNAKNAEELLVKGEVDGFLVGGASLKATEFKSIIMTGSDHGKK